MPGDPGVAAHDLPEGLPRQGRAARAGEQYLADQAALGLPRFEVRRHVVEGDLAEGHQPAFAALAQRADDAAGEIDVAEGQVHELADSEPRGIAHTEHRAVPQTSEPTDVRGVDQADHLLFPKVCGSLRPKRGRAASAVGSEAMAPSLTKKRTRPRTDERWRAALRGPRPALASDDCQALSRPRSSSRGSVCALVFEESRELCQIAPVAGDGVGRERPLDPKVRQVQIDGRVDAHSRGA